MEDLEENILKYGADQDLTKLRELLLKCDIDKLESLVNRSLSSSTFSRIWDYLLKAFQDTPECHQKRIRIILSVLNELEEREFLSSDVQAKLIQRLCMDLNKLETKHLVEICNFCLKSIQLNKVCSAISFSWKDLLPDTLRILSEKDIVEFNELEYSGQEFKTTFITTLCISNWNPAKITQLAAMFCDMSLNKDEHLKVVNKLSCYIEKLTPQEVPPFVYQLLRLCRHQNSRSVFLRLQHYFGMRIYNNANFTKSSSEESTPDFDIIENAEDHDALDAEGMVLYHIQNAASIGHNCIRDYLSSIKNTVKSPDFVLHPFQLLTLFTISTVAQYEETVFDIIRHAIVRCYNEQHKKASSYWYRDIVTTSVKPEEVFKQIMTVGDREFLLEALVHFGFVLLNVGAALGRDPIAEKQWTLGTMILLKIIKRKRNVAGEVLKTFCNHILTKQNATQYIECLYFLSRSSPLLMLENQSCVVELMDSLMQIPGNVAKQLLEALMPLTKVSPSIKDQLILILRKCLYSRSIETRQVAVFGYVKLLSILQLSAGASNGFLSQNSCGSFSSGYSLYTQISLNRTTQSASASMFSNEAICWEVLGILKRCFMQQVEVKLELYEDLYSAVCINPELSLPVLDVLWCHFMEYYVIDEEASPPLNLSQATLLRDMDCVLQEPVGKLIFVISQIVAKLNQAEDHAESATVQKYTDILDSLCRRMANCELVHLQLDDGTDLTDPLPESQQKMYILKEVISVFEALVGYKIAALSSGNDNQCGIINSLFQGWSRFHHFGKNLAKPKKAAKKPNKSTQKDDKATQKSTVQETQTKKVDNGVKRASKGFSAPDTLLDLAIVEKGLKTLLEPNVPWVATNDANKIRTKADLHRHMVQAAMFLIGKIKNSKAIESACHKNYFDHITCIAATLYDRIIKRANDYIDFDCAAAILGFECFHSTLLLVNGQYKNNVVNFLSTVGGKDKNESIIEHLKPIIDTFEKLFEAEEDELSNDPEVKKLSLAVLNNLAVLCSWIPSDSNVLSVEVYDWLKQIAYNNSLSSKVAGGFVNLLCETHLRFKSGLVLFEHISSSFLTVFGINRDDVTIEETDENLKIIHTGSGNIIVQSLCSYIRTVLEDVESVIARIKSDYCIVTYPGEDDTKRKEELKAKEKGVTCQLCFVAKILTNLATLALPPGMLADSIFKNIVQFYSALTSLTKYLLSRSTKNQPFQAGWFEKLVKLTGKRLAPEIYTFLYSLEMGQQKEEEQTQGARKKVEGAAMKSKILRDTKTIPKVIYEMEQFSKYILQLSKKTKCDLSKYVGQGTSRDFKINLQKIQGELQRAQANASSHSQEEEEEREQQAEAEPDIVESDNDINNSSVSSNVENGDGSPPPAKKTKR